MANVSGRLAAIGIGSNSVRLLIAEPVGGRLSAVERLETVTRLASYRSGAGGVPLLTEESIGKTWATAANFARHAAERGATLVGIIATEAVRSAANRSELTGPLEQELGVPVTIISGENEAELGWQTTSSGFEQGAALMVIDIGGASTDLSSGYAGVEAPEDVVSLKQGSRTLTRVFGLDEPVSSAILVNALGYLNGEWGHRIAPMQPRPHIGVVIGGTASVIADLRHHSLDGDSSTDALTERGWLADWLERAAAAGIEERVQMGIPRDRADIVVGGGLILLAIIDAGGLRHFYVSERNILDGFISRSIT